MATKYQALSHITHDGEAYPEGTTIELEDIHAKPLLDLGRIAPVAPSPAGAGEGGDGGVDANKTAKAKK